MCTQTHLSVRDAYVPKHSIKPLIFNKLCKTQTRETGTWRQEIPPLSLWWAALQHVPDSDDVIISVWAAQDRKQNRRARNEWLDPPGWSHSPCWAWDSEQAFCKFLCGMLKPGLYPSHSAAQCHSLSTFYVLDVQSQETAITCQPIAPGTTGQRCIAITC